MLDFKNASELLDVTYKICIDGELILLDKLQLESLSAKEEKWYDLKMPELPTGIITILFEYIVKSDNSLCKKGIILGHDQFIIKTSPNDSIKSNVAVFLLNH